MQSTDGKKYDFDINTENLQSTYGLAFSEIPNGSSVLELGCYNGNFLFHLKHKKDCTTKGLEYDSTAVNIAREKGVDVDEFNLETQSLGVLSEKYDYVLMLDVLEHLKYPSERLLNDIFQVLKENGKVIVSLPNFFHVDVLARIFSNTFEYKDVGLLDSTHTHFFTPADLIQIFWKQNFYCESIKKIILPPGGTEVNDGTPEFWSKVQEISKINDNKDSEVYQYFFVLKKSKTFNILPFDKHLLSHGINCIGGKKLLNSEKWNIIIRTTGYKNDLLLESIRSVISQSYSHKGILLIVHSDKGEIIEEVKKLTSQVEGSIEIKLFTCDSHKNKSGALNIALNNCDGKYVSFLDETDVYSPDFGDVLIEKLKNGQSSNFVYGYSLNVNQKKYLGIFKTIHKSKRSGEDFNVVKLVKSNYIPISTYVLNYETFSDIRFDESLDLLEDWDFILQLIMSKRIKGKYIPFKASESRMRDNNSSRESSNNNELDLCKRRIDAKYLGKPFQINYEDVS